MAWIHNEPAYSPESRMVFVLQDREMVETWLHGTAEEAQELIQPLPDGVLEYYPCRPVKANKKLNRVYVGNVPEIIDRVYYPELEEEQGTLF
jgi:putative SOS response-associated peptidase YedK